MEVQAKKHRLTRVWVHGIKSAGFVDAGACEGAHILSAKRADVLNEPATLVLKTAAGPVRVHAAKAHTRVKDFAWGQIEQLGEQARASDGTLSRAQANERVMKTDGRAAALLELYHDPDASLTVGDFAVKKQAEQDRFESLGARRWTEIVAKTTAAFADADPSARSREARLADAYDCVRRDYPHLWAQYEAERVGRR